MTELTVCVTKNIELGYGWKKGRKEEFARRKKRREGKKLTIKCNINFKEFDVTTKTRTITIG